jgi:RNA polymerase sigma-70 factor (ECF subfamily)
MPGDARSGEALVRTLYDEHGRYLVAYAARLTGDRQLAEDIVQETLLRAWKHADRLSEGQGSVRGWLLTVTRNIATDKARARRSRPPEVEESPEVHDVRTDRDHAEDVANSLVVADALRKLSPEHRAALIETYYVGRTMTEAAQVLGIPPGTVKSRVHYALQQLRGTLGPKAEGAA